VQIAVLGTGYVGLVVGACLSELGNDVACIDVDAAKVDALNAGTIPIYEPGLNDIVARNRREERLSFTTDGADALSRAHIVFIAVGTPSAEDGSADLTYVRQVSEAIGDHVAVPGVLVVCKSTVPIGTNAMVKDVVSQRAKVPFHIVSNPEFLKEGAAVRDFMAPDRIVIGSEHADAAEVMSKLYAPLVRTGAPIVHMDVVSAEMTKYAANAMLATRISFMNEIANLCDKVGGDVAQVRRGIGTDPRIGKHFLFPGVGYGGSCFPKDVRALTRTARGMGVPFRILEAVENVNTHQKRVLVNQVMDRFGADLSGLKLAVWGLAFKAQTDDMREAPSIVIINALLDAGASVSAFDPQAAETAQAVFGDRITYGRTPYDVLDGAAALLVVTDWNEFRAPNFGRVKQLMVDDPSIFDGRNLYDPTQLRDLGFFYQAIGRGSVA
jgi:UDPglucose 6-dehydrogenase